MSTQPRKNQIMIITRGRDKEIPDRVTMFHKEHMTPEEENLTWNITQMIITMVITIIIPMNKMTGSLMNSMKDPILLDPQEQVEALDQYTTLEEKTPETQVMVQETKEETPPEIITGTGREMEDSQIEVSAEKEGEEMVM